MEIVMIDEKEIMPLNFFAYGGIYSGQHNNMRYRLLRTGEKPDFNLEVCCWRGPYGYDAVLRDDKDSTLIKKASFTFDDEGRQHAIEWLKDEYKMNEQYYNDAPLPVFAPIDLEKIYH